MAAAATFTQDLECLRATEEFAVVALPAKQSAARQLTPQVEEVLRNVGGILDRLIISTIEKRTATEFTSIRDQVFPHYAQVMIALSGLASAIVPRDTLARITRESLCEMEADFRDCALTAFGPAIQEQGMFTIWTFRKIADAGQRLAACGKVAPEFKAKDAEFSGAFMYHALRSRFHLDCLLTSMNTGAPVYPEALNVVSDGLRSAVDAYGWIKQGLDLRLNVPEPTIEPVDLDDEDRIFLDASARDMTLDQQ